MVQYQRKQFCLQQTLTVLFCEQQLCICPFYCLFINPKHLETKALLQLNPKHSETKASLQLRNIRPFQGNKRRIKHNKENELVAFFIHPLIFYSSFELCDIQVFVTPFANSVQETVMEDTNIFLSRQAMFSTP